MADNRYKRPSVPANFRWPPEFKTLVVQEAALAGVTQTDWVLAAVANFARRPDMAPEVLRQEVLQFRDSA
ncbi:hypothetical protein [Gordonia sihwensis]|uniref:hypothetical protein n=1 Tax=Gordonia sihwensis TaxID=173559 RepID=UPI003D9751DC